MRDILTKSLAIQSNHLGRAAHACLDTVTLAATAPGAETYGEVADLATATLERIARLEASWLDQWTDWMDYAGTLAGVDTTPKFVERTGNILLQAHAQLISQAVDLADLSENLSVSYAFWVNRQLDRRNP